MLKLRLLLLSIFVLCSACSSFNKEAAPRVFQIERKWARYTPKEMYLGAKVNHRMTPVIFGDFVIQGNAIDGISAYKKTSGAVVWTRRFNGGVETGAVINGSTLLFGANDGFFYALDAYTGNTRWSFPIKSEGLGIPTVKDDVVYFVVGNNTTYAVNVSSGEQLWFYSRVNARGMTVRGSSQPSLVKDLVLVGYSDGTLVALNKATGTLKWERPLGGEERFADIDAKAILHEGKVYVSSYDGLLYCLNPDNGNIFWSSDAGGFSTPEINEDRIYTSTSKGEVVALELSSGKRVWSYKVANSVATAPVYYRGLLIFGEWQGELVALDASNGKKVSSYATGRGVTSTPVLDPSDSRLYVMTIDANLFSFELNWKKQSEKWEWEKAPYL